MSDRPARRVPTQARAKQKVQRIIEAARQILVQDGPEAFNTNLVAKRAGVGIGSLYEYFPNKQAVFDHMIEELSTTETDAVLASLATLESHSLSDAVARIVRLVSGLHRTNHLLYRALWALSKNPRDSGQRPAEKAIMAQIRQVLRPHADALQIDDLDLTCFTVFHLVESLAEQLASPAGTRWDSEAGEAEITKVVLRYLGVPHEDPAQAV